MRTVTLGLFSALIDSCAAALVPCSRRRPPLVRLRRPEHDLDADGPRRQHEVGSIDEIGDLLAG